MANTKTLLKKKPSARSKKPTTCDACRVDGDYNPGDAFCLGLIVGNRSQSLEGFDSVMSRMCKSHVRFVLGIMVELADFHRASEGRCGECEACLAEDEELSVRASSSTHSSLKH